VQAAETKIVLTDFLERLGAASASALLLDYDGTLAPFQKERHRAYPYPGVVPILEGIMRAGKTRVIVVTGRPIRELQALLPLEGRLEVWGEHGLEHLLADGTCRQTPIAPEIAEALAQAGRWLNEANLTSLAEIKRGGLAVHWRGLPDAEREQVRARTLEGWAKLAEQPGIKLLRFEGGLELRSARPNKGDAMAAILEEMDSGTQIAFLGDDLTDEDAFRALGERGLSILVRPEYRETRANLWLKPPQELLEFLTRWLNYTSTP
jgi:trehalose-phosphatase